ncbi:hypothetical protein A3753_10510 [Sulfitobacter sp. HI0082]|jgi:hypothetical protein|uniref:DUF2065 domain-containing protein n=1 Tax=unclassified Sulfitobacter TaxID=196795 RepID=UPI0007C35E86|nr:MULTISPECIES: DUF2065 domain-containing protein [unclassified Sulfitobacter]KZZ29845.1 hypothetical protein A3753_10510 [Sulfitobacter sp. HI0082]HAC51147.1 DUF2065 domain-containing protein [Sulfitobacter sp.]KZX96941.1 hypothetical protein A3722_14435 [Sulfitobacter sp. HI0027]KZX98090.1 hypothetical protein A3720_16770 [Sulfitobacter sp. HI0021]KZY98929.1 hypothetical protein A3747_07695 [Sulfitobacter sp. HI0076]|tara:strand:- start:890 stop:1084 length:195 start_codon:yes stop_codon:yes gene_type:complete
MSLVLLALGSVLIFEGLVYALAPSFLEQMLEMLRRIPEAALRQLGALVVVAGLIFVWLAFQLGV